MSLPLTASQREALATEAWIKDTSWVQRGSDIEPRETKWVWYPYLPAGKVTLLEGDPGMGKSWIACDIASRISTGNKFPGSKATLPPQKTLIMTAEDDLSETLVPRLLKLGANMENILLGEDQFSLDEKGIKKVEYMMGQTAATVVFLDPIVGFMGSKIDMHRANEVRPWMAMLKDAAKRTGTAVVGIRHLRKAGGNNVNYRGLGSIDLTAAARSALQVGKTKDGRTFMEHVKHNLSPQGDTLEYKIEDNVFEWVGPMTYAETKPRVNTTRRNIAERILHDMLKDGPRKASEVIHAGEDMGVSRDSMFKARKGLTNTKKQGAEWIWELKEREGMGDMLSPLKGVSVIPLTDDLDPAVIEEALRRAGIQ